MLIFQTGLEAQRHLPWKTLTNLTKKTLLSIPADSVWLDMANYPLQYKTRIAIQLPTLVVEPVRAPNIVHCHKWDRTLHIFMWVWVHVGNVGVRDGVKTNTKCNITISEHSALQMWWRKCWPDQENIGMLTLALCTLPKRRSPHEEPCKWRHCVLWFCDVFQCPWFYSCMASFVIDDHFVSTQCWREEIMLLLHGFNHRWSSRGALLLKRRDYLYGPELCTVCAHQHILCGCNTNFRWHVKLKLKVM